MTGLPAYLTCAEAAVRAAQRPRIRKRHPLALISAQHAQAQLLTALAALGPWKEEPPPIDVEPDDDEPKAELLRERTDDERYAAILAVLPAPDEWVSMTDIRTAARIGEKRIRRLCDELCRRGQLTRREAGRLTYYARLP